MTDYGIFHHDIRHILKNKNNVHIMVNDSWSPIPQVQEKKKQDTTHDVNRTDGAWLFKKIPGQTVKKILHVVDNSIQ